MIKATPNSNFQSLSGSVLDNDDPKYLEYRRQWIENPLNFIVNDFPIHLDIEITNRCNLKCVFCDKLPLLSPDEFGDMDFKLYKKIVDEGTENDLFSIKLSYRGEPLLHPDVSKMVEYAKKNGVIDVYFNTNGMLLTERKAYELIQAGLDRISVSVEGTDRLAFERQRIGANFNKILLNIDRLIAIREKEKAFHPKIRVQTVALPTVDLKDFDTFWRQHADETAAVDFKEAINREDTLVQEDWACPQLWQRMTIEVNGTIMPCNNDDYRLLSPGNVRELKIRDCWNSPIVADARNSHKTGHSHLVESCNGCPWRTTQIHKLKSALLKHKA